MNIDLNKNTHVSFDLWLTLIKSHADFKYKRNLLFRDFFEISQNIETVAAAIRHFDVFCNDTNQRTGLNFDTFEIYYLILDRLQVDVADIEAAKLSKFYLACEDLFLNHMPILIVDGLENVLKDLQSRNITTNILSNTAFLKGITLRKVLEYYQLTPYFNFQIYSDETKISKPNPAMFGLVYEQANVIKKTHKHQILHIGDNPIADFEGALNFGFNAQLV